MKIAITGFLALLSISAMAQSDSPTVSIPIPMKNGIVFYEQSYTVSPNLKKEELYNRTYEWFTRTFRRTEQNIELADKTTGRFKATGAFKVVTSASGNYYWLKPVFDITVADGHLTCAVYNFYEKPVEQGISNEYSKIEYRWRDYRQGKPWSAEDKRLFQGLNGKTLELMAALLQVVNK